MYSYYIFITTPQLADKGQQKWRKVDLVAHVCQKQTENQSKENGNSNIIWKRYNVTKTNDINAV